MKHLYVKNSSICFIFKRYKVHLLKYNVVFTFWDHSPNFIVKGCTLINSERMEGQNSPSVGARIAPTGSGLN